MCSHMVIHTYILICIYYYIHYVGIQNHVHVSMVTAHMTPGHLRATLSFAILEQGPPLEEVSKVRIAGGRNAGWQLPEEGGEIIGANIFATEQLAHVVIRFHLPALLLGVPFRTA